MAVEKSTTLKCDHCGKKETFTGDSPEKPRPFVIKGQEYFGGGLYYPPVQWYIIQPDYEKSLWSTADFSKTGNFCSLECMRDFILAAIEERDNPSPMRVQAAYIEANDT